jgi:hypothetical protein
MPAARIKNGVIFFKKSLLIIFKIFSFISIQITFLKNLINNALPKTLSCVLLMPNRFSKIYLIDSVARKNV